MNNHHFIAIDVDGTLLNDQDCFDIERLNRDVAALKDRGYYFIVASGNSGDALTTLFRPCPLVQTFVAENGGRIIVDGHQISGQAHSHKKLQQLLTILATEYPAPDILSLSGQSQTYIASQYRHVPVPYYPHHTYFTDLAEITEPIYNLNAGWFKQRLALTHLQKYVLQLNQQVSGIQATYSGAYGIDILPAGVNKATGLKALVEDHFASSLQQVIAFGDTSNDIEMLGEVGCGYAMKNATPDLLAVADRVTRLDNNHEGLLVEIEERFL